jgi:RNA-binding protein YhbY
MSDVMVRIPVHVIQEIKEHLENIRHPKVEYNKNAEKMKDAVIDNVYDEAGYIQDLLNQNGIEQ